MNRSLRSRHRFLIGTVTVLVAAVVVAALAARSITLDPAQSLPQDLALAMGRITEKLESTRELERWPGLPIELRFDAHATPPQIELLASEEIRAPDLLLYWRQQEPETGSALPTDATLLGRVHGVGSSSVPASTLAVSQGYLILYSLGHEVVLGTTSISRPQEGN